MLLLFLQGEFMGMLLILAVAVFIFIKTPTFKGIIGEFIIKLIIGETSEVPGQEKYVIHDLLLRTDGDNTTQIDHIVINSSGIYVIETKNYKGRIYGDDYQKQWTQVLNYGKVKYPIYSPVRQNYKHVCVIKQFFPEYVAVNSLVVFIRGNVEYIKSNYVCSPWELNRRMNVYSEYTLSPYEMKSIYETLLNNNISDTISRWQHAENIKRKKSDNDYYVNNNICPKCKGNLIKKRGRYGEYLACCHYPDCKFTISVKK